MLAKINKLLVLDQSIEGIQKTIDNSDVALDDVVDVGVEQDEYIFTYFQSPLHESFGEDCVSCECVRSSDMKL